MKSGSSTGQAAPQHLAQQLNAIHQHCAVHRHHVRHQPPLPRHVLAHDHRRRRHLGLLEQPRLDLAQLDPVTADLHLLIRAPHVLQRPVPPLPRPVSGAIQPLARRTERIGHEDLRGPRRIRQIPLPHPDARHAQLADHPTGTGASALSTTYSRVLSVGRPIGIRTSSLPGATSIRHSATSSAHSAGPYALTSGTAG